jgi:hypothetical protein
MKRLKSTTDTTRQRSKVSFLDNLDEGTDRTNNWSHEPTLILLFPPVAYDQ